MIDINDNTWAIELVEGAEREFPFCAACGEVTQTVDHHDSLWLECPTLATTKPLLRRLLTLDFAVGHTRRLILETTASRFAA